MTVLAEDRRSRVGRTSSRPTAIAAWILATIAITLGVLMAVMLVVASSSASQEGLPEPWMAIPVLLYFLAAPLVGALIVSRAAEGKSIGWLFIVMSGGLAFGLLADTYATHALRSGDGETFPVLVKWLGTWLSVPAFASLPLLALLFPSGRPASPRWRPVIWTTLAGGLGLVLSEAFRPDVVIFSGIRQVLELRPNPLGVPAGLGPLIELVGAGGILLILGSALAATASLIVRFRRSRGIERQQLKWFAFAMATLAAMLLFSSALGLAESVLGAVSPMSDVVWHITISLLSLLPLAAGVAILQYRLYDIDVLINRALVYGAVTAVLGASYVASVVLLQTGLRPFTGGSEFAVAISTLVVVALFQPARRRIQDAVDRRFYRSRYDAERTLDAFADRLRDEVDLDELRQEIVSVVDETIRPAHASVWLRGTHS